MIDSPGAAVSLPSWRVERILYDGQGLLVVDKPVGMPVHGGDEALSHSVVQRVGEWLTSQGRDDYLGVHQRLDQETSGLLFFVTDKEKNPDVAKAVAAHQIERTYWAVVEGAANLKDADRVELSLRHERGRTEVEAKPKKGAKKGKRAVTHYTVLRRNDSRALVELRLETGRTHQIRVTLAHLGAPIVGDRLYGGAPAHRMMLHAGGLSGGPLEGSHSTEVPRALSEALAGSPDDVPPLDEIKERLRDAATLRAPLTVQTSAFRLVNGVGDGLPGMTVDAYGKFASLNLYEEALSPHAESIASWLVELGFAGVYLKQRVRANLREEDASELAPNDVFAGSEAPESYTVDEFGMQVNIELKDGLSTGLFVDMRDNRMKARGWAAVSRSGGAAQVLNLFSYTCSFSVSAALSGASTTSVDLSGRALERGRLNFAANGLPTEHHRFFKEDAMKFLSRSVRREDKYDFIVLDPPSFATVGKGTFSVKGRYQEAATDCMRLLSPGGRLLCVTNHTKTSTGAFRKMIRGAAEAAGRKLRYLKDLNPGLDCPLHPHGPWPSKAVLSEVE